MLAIGPVVDHEEPGETETGKESEPKVQLVPVGKVRKVSLPTAKQDVDVIEDERKDEKHDETDAYAGCHR